MRRSEKAVPGALRRLGAAEAQEVLDSYEPVIRRLVGRRGAWHVDRDDLLQTARLAVLEAHKSWDEARGCSRKTWTLRVVRWRLAAQRRLLPSEAPTETPVLNGSPPDKRYLNAFVRESIGVLSPRQANVLDGRLRGYTLQEIGDQLGLTPQRVYQEERAAIRALRTLHWEA